MCRQQADGQRGDVHLNRLLRFTGEGAQNRVQNDVCRTIEHRDGNDVARDVHREARTFFAKRSQRRVGQRVGRSGFGKHAAEKEAHGNNNAQSGANAAKARSDAAHQFIQIHSRQNTDCNCSGNHREKRIHLEAHNGHKQVYHRRQK